MSSSDVVNLHGELRLSACECLNQSPESSLTAILTAEPPAAAITGLRSDSGVDSQLLITLQFQSLVKLKHIRLLATSDDSADCSFSGPKQVRLFINRPNLSFADCESEPPTEILQLTPSQLGGDASIMLKFVKYQSVQSLTLFVESNQNDSEVTGMQWLAVFGSTREGMNVAEIKKQEE
jgi:hypothetical protein